MSCKTFPISWVFCMMSRMTFPKSIKIIQGQRWTLMSHHATNYSQDDGIIFPFLNCAQLVARPWTTTTYMKFVNVGRAAASIIADCCTTPLENFIALNKTYCRCKVPPMFHCPKDAMAEQAILKQRPYGFLRFELQRVLEGCSGSPIAQGPFRDSLQGILRLSPPMWHCLSSPG